MDRKPERAARLDHDRVWQAIDSLAVSRGLTASGLAIRAGLDATALNRSKRNGRNGRPRWPTLDSIARILEAADCDVDEFFGLTAGAPPSTAPLSLHWTIAGDAGLGTLPGFLEAARPISPAAWSRKVVPEHRLEPLLAVEVVSSGLLPLYGPGDTLILSPGAEIGRGDRVLAYVAGEGLIARRIVRSSRGTISFAAMPHVPETTISRKAVIWQARVVWVSQ